MFDPANPVFRRLRKHAQKRLVFEPGVARGHQLPAYKRFLELENEMLKRDHRKGDSGLRVCQARAAMIDVMVENLFIAALNLWTTRNGALPCKMSVLATGGYGRAELNPHSDIDIMLLYPERIRSKDLGKFQEQLAEEIFYPLWDLGLKVGHASRNTREVIAECRREIMSKNAIVESRMICGSESLYKQFATALERYYRKENPTEYLKQRLEDEKERHQKAGGTAFVQEPDVKNGVGGLRDYQNILWMANIKHGYASFRELEKARFLRRDERVRLDDAYDFLLRVRTELHLQNRRPTEKLNLEIQPLVGENLGYRKGNDFRRVEAFMKDYYSAARTIYHTSDLLKERLALSAVAGKARITFREAIRSRQAHARKTIDGFILAAGVFSAETKQVFKQDPDRMIRIFRLMQQFGARPDPDLKFLIARSLPLIDSRVIQSEAAAKSFRSILQAAGEVHPVLNLMHELGVLGRYVPEFDGLTCLVQHEYYHRYTADVHVLNTIRELDVVFRKDDARAAQYEKELRKNDHPSLLYLILLLHDIGKAEGIRGHAQSGVRLAGPILRRLRIGEEQTSQISFIIRNHLEMARFWQRFDLEDPQTAASFAQLVDDPQNLRFLYVHTYCDARGTAPSLWNDYKDAMHRLLFRRTLEQFGDQAQLERKRKEQTAMFFKELIEREIEGVSREEVEAHFNLLPERYFINTGPEEIELHLRMVHELLESIQNAESVGALVPILDWRNDLDQSMTVVNVVTWDRAGLFYKLAGALSVAGVNILSTKAISRTDHITIDTFYVIDPGGGVVTRPKAREIFTARLKKALVEGTDLLTEIEAEERRHAAARKQKKNDLLPAPFPPSVDVYHELSLKRTIIEVQANDRVGLLYRLSRLIFEKGFDITFARVATERGVAMDTFYIESVQPQDQSDTTNLLALREALNEVVGESGEG